MFPEREPMLSRDDVARELNVSRSTVGHLLRAGTIHSIRVGSAYRIPRESLEAYKMGRPSPYAADRPEHQQDESTWPPTPSMLAAIDGRDADEGEGDRLEADLAAWQQQDLIHEIGWVAREARALIGSSDEDRRARYLERKDALMAALEQQQRAGLPDDHHRIGSECKRDDCRELHDPAPADDLPGEPEPRGFLAATAHDFGDHRRCDPRSCPNADPDEQREADEWPRP